eukprot:6439125-Pyramimonas_sp.AAC.1
MVLAGVPYPFAQLNGAWEWKGDWCNDRMVYQHKELCKCDRLCGQVIKPLLSHSTTGEFDSPPNCSPPSLRK